MLTISDAKDIATNIRMETNDYKEAFGLLDQKIRKKKYNLDEFSTLAMLVGFLFICDMPELITTIRDEVDSLVGKFQLRNKIA